MREIGAVAAKRKFGELLDQVEQGEEILITRRGRPVARLVAAAPGFDREKARRAVAGILETSKGVRLGGLKIKDLVGEGRP
jgi:prevent-host-death family protein